MNRKQRRASWRGQAFGRVLRIYKSFANYYQQRKQAAHLGR